MKLGFFDSGIGGLTILEETHKLMPAYDTIYLGDSARSPYGEKTQEDLVRFLTEAVTWLFDKDCDLIIVACNTASVKALRIVQDFFLKVSPEKRILGVVRPTAERLAQGQHKKILILSTEATAQSQVYVDEFKRLNPEVEVFSHSCPRWASMIEAGKAGTHEMKFEVERELHQALKQGDPDVVLLACTHYPFVKSDVEQALPHTVQVLNQGPIVAHSLRDYLNRHPIIEGRLGCTSERSYFTTGNAKDASFLASQRFQIEVEFESVTL